MGISKNGWFIAGNPIYMDDFGIPPFSRNLPTDLGICLFLREPYQSAAKWSQICLFLPFQALPGMTNQPRLTSTTFEPARFCTWRIIPLIGTGKYGLFPWLSLVVYQWLSSCLSQAPRIRDLPWEEHLHVRWTSFGCCACFFAWDYVGLVDCPVVSTRRFFMLPRSGWLQVDNAAAQPKGRCRLQTSQYSWSKSCVVASWPRPYCCCWLKKFANKMCFFFVEVVLCVIEM